MQKPHALVWRSQSGSQTVTIAVIPGPGWTVSPVSESFIYSHCCAAVAHLYTPLPPRAGSQSVSCKLVGWLVCSFAQVVWRSATLLRSLGRLVAWSFALLLQLLLWLLSAGNPSCFCGACFDWQQSQLLSWCLSFGHTTFGQISVTLLFYSPLCILQLFLLLLLLLVLL